MNQHYECLLETEGYRLKISVYSDGVFSAERMARQRAVRLLKENYGICRNEKAFKVVDVQKKSSPI